MQTMRNVGLLFGGHSEVEYDHDLSVGAYLGIMADQAASPASEFRVRTLYYISQEGKLFSHFIENPDAYPQTVQELSTGSATSVLELPVVLHRDGSRIHCLLYGENADAFYPGIEQFFALPSRFGDVYGGAIGRHKWTQSLVANTLFPEVLSPIPSYVLPLNEGLEGRGARECLRMLGGQACFVKSNRLHMSAHSTAIDALTPKTLAGAMAAMRGHDEHVLVQAFIQGLEYTCGCIRTAKGIVGLPVLRIHVEERHLDFKQKVGGASVDCTICSEPTDLIQAMVHVSVEMSRFMGIGASSRSDFIVANDRIHYLETNVTPGLHDFSPFTRMLRAVGMSRLDLIRHALESFDVANPRPNHIISLPAYHAVATPPRQ